MGSLGGCRGGEAAGDQGALVVGEVVGVHDEIRRPGECLGGGRGGIGDGLANYQGCEAIGAAFDPRGIGEAPELENDRGGEIERQESFRRGHGGKLLERCESGGNGGVCGGAGVHGVDAVGERSGGAAGGDGAA